MADISGEKGKPGRFLFYFCSQAYYSERWGAFPRKGVEEYGSLAHKYGIKVTWLTNGKGAEQGKDIFTRFHREFGDEVILWLNPDTASGTTSQRLKTQRMSEKELEEFILKERETVKKHLPFAKTEHCGYFYRTMNVVRVLERLGFKSVYGHCWHQINVDGVTDYGTPWGFYYIDTERSWKRPKRPSEGKGLVANEWLQHDLNKVWNYYGSGSVFSYDPNDVERAALCTDTDIEYWKAAFREYYRNIYWNEIIPFVFHQEAHEQESTPGGWEVYPPEIVEKTYKMTESFLQFVKSEEFPLIEFVTLPEAVEIYLKTFDRTHTSAMLFRDVRITASGYLKRWEEIWELYNEIKKEEEEEGGSLDVRKDYPSFKYLGFPYGWQGMVQNPPGKYFPECLIYRDVNCQMLFRRNIPFPVEIHNYLMEIDTSPENLYYNPDLFVQPPDFTVYTEFGDFKGRIGPNGDIPYGYSDLPKFSGERKVIVKLETKEILPFGTVLWPELWNEISKPVITVNGERINVNTVGEDPIYYFTFVAERGTNTIEISPKTE